MTVMSVRAALGFAFFCACAALTADAFVKDWLLNRPTTFPAVEWSKTSQNNVTYFELSNGLISRKFIASPNFGTIGYSSLLTEPPSPILRTLFPEALITLDGVHYDIGGVAIDPQTLNATVYTSAYLDSSWMQGAAHLEQSGDGANTTLTFAFSGDIAVSEQTTIPYAWVPGVRHSPSSAADVSWPPRGLSVEIEFVAPATAPSVVRGHIRVYVRYEMFQGMPILSKQLRVVSTDPSATQSVILSGVVVEQLGVNVPFSPGSLPAEREAQPWFDPSLMLAYSGALWLETDTAHGTAVVWSADPRASATPGSFQPVVAVEYAPNDQQTEWAVRLAPTLPGTQNGVFESFRAFEIVYGGGGGSWSSTAVDMERQGLGRRRLIQALAPATTENPVFAQTVHIDNASLHSFVDQCHATAFEMMVFSFGCGFNMETTDEATLAFYQTIIEYAHSQGVEVGGYDLIVLDRTVANDVQVVEVNGKYKNTVCMASKWYDQLTGYFDNFMDIGLDMFITDGPYGGNSCASKTHEYHDGLADSVFRQEYLQQAWFVYYKYYQSAKIPGKNIYVHQPDNYWYFGGSRSGMGYNENQYSLPRWMDLTVSRQGMYDDTYAHTVTQGWMFMPLVAYHSNNPDTYFEPLSEHSAIYNFSLGQYFGYGVMSTMRGYELYDTQSTHDIVNYWTAFYNLHRPILISNLIHLRRPDLQSFDAVLHANAWIQESGLAVIYNPTAYAIVNQNFTFSLYYTGAKSQVMISHQDNEFTLQALRDLYYVTLNINMEPKSITYYVFQNSNTIPNAK